jgi:hypothetical protein
MPALSSREYVLTDIRARTNNREMMASARIGRIFLRQEDSRLSRTRAVGILAISSSFD